MVGCTYKTIDKNNIINKIILLLIIVFIIANK